MFIKTLIKKPVKKTSFVNEIDNIERNGANMKNMIQNNLYLKFKFVLLKNK